MSIQRQIFFVCILTSSRTCLICRSAKIFSILLSCYSLFFFFQSGFFFKFVCYNSQLSFVSLILLLANNFLKIMVISVGVWISIYTILCNNYYSNFKLHLPQIFKYSVLNPTSFILKYWYHILNFIFNYIKKSHTIFLPF